MGAFLGPIWVSFSFFRSLDQCFCSYFWVTRRRARRLAFSTSPKKKRDPVQVGKLGPCKHPLIFKTFFVFLNFLDCTGLSCCSSACLFALRYSSERSIAGKFAVTSFVAFFFSPMWDETRWWAGVKWHGHWLRSEYFDIAVCRCFFCCLPLPLPCPGPGGNSGQTIAAQDFSDFHFQSWNAWNFTLLPPFQWAPLSGLWALKIQTWLNRFSRSRWWNKTSSTRRRYLKILRSTSCSGFFFDISVSPPKDEKSTSKKDTREKRTKPCKFVRTNFILN